MKPAKKFGGRPKGAKNKSTVAREEQAKAEIAAAIRNAGKGADPKSALAEMYKAVTIAEGIAGKLQPKDIAQDEKGVLKVSGGDLKGFGEWFDRWFKCVEVLAKYQLPPMKAMDAPAPPPDPADLERTNRRRFTLRVFEGGRPIREPGSESDGEDEE